MCSIQCVQCVIILFIYLCPWSSFVSSLIVQAPWRSILGFLVHLWVTSSHYSNFPSKHFVNICCTNDLIEQWKSFWRFRVCCHRTLYLLLSPITFEFSKTISYLLGFFERLKWNNLEWNWETRYLNERDSFNILECDFSNSISKIYKLQYSLVFHKKEGSLMRILV